MLTTSIKKKHKDNIKIAMNNLITIRDDSCGEEITPAKC